MQRYLVSFKDGTVAVIFATDLISIKKHLISLNEPFISITQLDIPSR
nr:MAG TPA: hypothetical protein [Caudoviricetes sp.]